jgi:ABC-type Zn uptake system ZnuABC Zn-binding protein ZnuA
MLTVLLFLLTACASRVSTAPGAGPVVLASISFLTDIAQKVAGDRLTVGSLLPFGTDPHSYQPVPADSVKIEQSTLLIINGIEYEHFIESLLENADGERLIVTASDGLEPLHMAEAHPDDAEHEHEAGDPHMWLDPNLVIIYVENIRAGLTEADPQGADVYQANADAYTAQLKDLDAWITEQVAQIPLERRILVTNHEALGYFADRYGFQIAGTVLTSVSSAASPSARELSEVIDEIKATGAPAIFLDEVENQNFAQQIAEETGVIVVADLHLESLTDGAPAATYIDMMRYNVSRIVEALK